MSRRNQQAAKARRREVRAVCDASRPVPVSTTPLDFQLPECLNLADWEDMPVPEKMRRKGVVRAVGWPCLDPFCPVPRDDGGVGPGVHFLMFTKGQDAAIGFGARLVRP